MIVIVNDYTPLTVKDQEGNVLYEWQPTTMKDAENMTMGELANYLSYEVLKGLKK